jgi:predicted acylesterase/phospholipase RssA
MAAGAIGLSLSGGGYRAAAFHLGALRCLERVGLLPRVEMLSTVSGGSFTGVAWALACVERRPFTEFEASFARFLREVPLVDRALDRLTRPARGPRRHDLVTAVADVYAETFLRAPDGRPYRFGALLDADLPLRELTINATEFRTGLAFRFQRSASPLARIGNGNVAIPRAVARDLRLADVVAASSCFPGGFEPMAFPDDFDWPGGEPPEPARAAIGPVPVALMDGGIYDNQGIQGLLLAGDRGGEERGVDRLDLLVVSDTDQEAEPLYAFPPRNAKRGLRLGTLALLGWGLGLLCVLTLVLVCVDAARAWQAAGGARVAQLAFLLPVAFVLLVAYALLWLRRMLRAQLARVPHFRTRVWPALRALRLHPVLAALDLRMTSLHAMASRVFMKRVRALVYERLYRDARYERKRVSNLIHHLRPGKPFPLAGVPPPSAALHEAVEIANAMPTTLWFDDPRQLDALVRTGEATLCFNLLKHLQREHGPDPARYPSDAATLWRRALDLWQNANAAAPLPRP